MRTLSSSFALSFLYVVALGADDLRIHNASELISFSNNVNSGTNYSGTTVYLVSDIDFTPPLSQQFEPIGNASFKHFQGTFDGQGHTINNLIFNSSTLYVGLFGNSKEGAIIKNVVLADSCSFVSSSTFGNPNIGGISGYCESCTIDSIVNMASATYIGNESSSHYLGGIVGRAIGSSAIKNCVNYGPVTYSGASSTNSNVGGVVGFCGGDGTKYIQNCANYGAITHGGESKKLYMGGIIGNSFLGVINIENCVSGGRIVNSGEVSGDNYVGSITGSIGDATIKGTTNVANCLWTSDVGYDKAYGYKYSNTDVTVTNSSLRELTKETVVELNEYIKKNSTWSKWFMLHPNGGRINNLTQEKLVVTQKNFPDPVKEGYTFLFWCKDAGCTEKYDPKTTSISGVTDLYAQWNVFVVTLDGNGGTPSQQNKSVLFNKAYGALPEPTRSGHTFAGWFTGASGGERVTEEDIVGIARDHTLYAHWTANNYTITFIFNTKENEVRSLNFNETIVYPENLTREGYTFNGWSPKSETMPSENITVTAQWAINNYTITFVFNNGKENEVRTLNFNQTIVYPENLTKEGFIFNGWYPKPERMPAEDIIVTAQWIEKPVESEESSLESGKSQSEHEESSSESEKSLYSSEEPSEFVEIVFGKKDLKEEEIKEVIQEYVKVDFTIVKIETANEAGETKIIVKFNDKETAESFVELIKAGSGKKSAIIRVSYIYEKIRSWSLSLRPVFPFLIFA